MFTASGLVWISSNCFEETDLSTLKATRIALRLNNTYSIVTVTQSNTGPAVDHAQLLY